MALIAGFLLQAPTPATAQVVTYQVNSKGQVTQATYPNGTVVTYAYDNNGNRLSATAVAPAAPSAPGSVASSGLTGNSATISWAAATDNAAITGYTYQVTSGGQAVSSGTTSGTQTSLNLTGLAPGDTYTITLSAQNADNETGAASTYSFTLPPSAPGTPTFSNVTGTSATAIWTAASSSAGITGYRYQLNGGSWSGFSTVLSANLSGLSNSTTYTVGVQAQDGNGTVSATSTGSFTTEGVTAPGAVTASNITGTSATVSWTAGTSSASSTGITGYSYQINGGAWSGWSNTLSANLTGLAYGTTYTVGVRDEDGAGDVSPTATTSFVTLPSTPGTPTASNINGTSATVSWTAASGANGISNYRYQLNGGSWSSWSSALSVNLTGLSYGTAYTIGVEAEDAAGRIGAIATGTFTTLPNIPGVPSFSNITGSSATVSWAAAAGDTAYSYQVNGGSWSGWSSATSVNLTGLAYGTAYSVGIRAEGANGVISSSSSAASFTTLPGAPGTPTFSNITGTSATVSWTAASSAAGVSAYRYSTNGGSSWTSVGTARTVNLTGLSRSTAYTVLVQAQSVAGAWGASSSGAFTTSAYYTDTFTMTVGGETLYEPVQTVGGVFQAAVGQTTGYIQGGLGSLSPATTSTGQSVAVVTDVVITGAATGSVYLQISGFSASPGIGWLQSISVFGNTLSGSSATFSYSGTTATWTWSSVSIPASIPSSLVIVHP